MKRVEIIGGLREGSKGEVVKVIGYRVSPGCVLVKLDSGETVPVAKTYLAEEKT